MVKFTSRTYGNFKRKQEEVVKVKYLKKFWVNRV